MKPRLLDLFSGIGGFSLAFHRAGFETVAFSEIEPFPCSVLAHRFCGVPNLGDITRWRDWDWDAIEHVDVVTFGSPCQDLSVAGKRAGLSGERSGLFHDAVGVIQRSGARYALWENVPGAFSSNGGWDFASVLDALADIGAVDIAWRVLDARYFGVPQRRRRIFLIADFGGECAHEILFEPEGVPGDLAPGGESGESVAALTSNGVGTCGADDNQGQAGDLLAYGGYTKGQGGTVVATPFDTTQITSDKNYSNPRAGDPCHPLAPGAHPPAVAFQQNQRDEVRLVAGDGSLAGALPAEPGMKQQNYIAFESRYARNGRGAPSEVVTPLKAESGKGDAAPLVSVGLHGEISGGIDDVARSVTTSNGQPPGLASGDGVRRLTPTECERLQGFPDGWTDVPYRKAIYSEPQGMDDEPEIVGWTEKPASDGPRYRALGNSVAVPVVEWIVHRMKQAFA